MKKMILKTLVLGISLIAFSGCKPATKQGVRSYNATVRNDIVNNGGTGGTGGPVLNPTCTNGQSAIGAIFDTSTNAHSFEQRVKMFLSATTPPEDVGSISSDPTNNSTGVRFQARIRLDSSGHVIAQESQLAIKVYDSFVTGDVGPIPVTINTAHAGQFNLQTGQGYVTFRDNYGEVRLEGHINTQYFQGTVSFANTVTVIPNSSPASGVLGSFSITTCGVIQ